MGLFGFIPFAFVTADAERAAAQSNSVQSAGARSSISASTVAIEGGVLGVEQPGGSSVSAAAIAVSARRATANMALFGSALLVGSSDSSTATQATIGGEFVLPRWPSLRAELAGTATIFGVLSGDHGSSRNAYFRPQFVRENYGAFASVGAGVVHREDSLRFHSLAWDVGAWTRRNWLTAVVSAGRSFTNDYPLMETSNFFLSRPARHYAMQDLQATVTATLWPVEVQIGGTFRQGLGATDGRAKSLLGAFTYNITERFALTVNAGRQLAAPLSGAPTANLVGASLRVYALGGDVARAASQRTSAAGASSRYATRVERHPTGGATVTVRVNAPANSRVELSGSHNDWSVVPVPSVNGVFELTVELPRGTHRLAVRINGGQWKAPAGLARVQDDLGGESGIVVVP